MSGKRLLISLAHPDDESFGLGGLIGKCVAEGVEVYYICATKGDRGTIADEHLQKYGSIEAVRDAELECASKVLGFKKVYKLGYSDSGMKGSPINDDPHCLIQADETVVTGQIADIMREVQPQVVITFDPFGGYGHPDHIFMHHATTRAFHETGIAQKLYYMVLSRRQLQVVMLMMRLRGINPRKVGVNQDLDFVEILQNALLPTTKISIYNYVDLWLTASACHASQVNSRTGLPRFIQRVVTGRQSLYRAFPEVSNGAGLERDIFERVRL
ncbi:MAG: PIG-L family deacetylase [Anaerolineae bacterium]|nr:PIG-L family deacetylase [Anaerolineae bacterium]